MNECSKAISRRLHTPGFTCHYFVGDGLDVGSGRDGLGRWATLFPRIRSVTEFDLPQGDAQYLRGIPDDRYDFLHSSHCLEHLPDPLIGLRNWLRVVRPGGYVVVIVPDEDLYEQGVWPSTFNPDHKRTFTIHKTRSWSPVSINVTDLAGAVSEEGELVRLELLHATQLPVVDRRVDQTLTAVAESAIEFVMRKRRR